MTGEDTAEFVTAGMSREAFHAFLRAYAKAGPNEEFTVAYGENDAGRGAIVLQCAKASFAVPVEDAPRFVQSLTVVGEVAGGRVGRDLAYLGEQVATVLRMLEQRRAGEATKH